MKILVVDDSAEVRRLIKSLIADIADEIYECSDGAEAVEIFIKQRPDWTLMDVYMKKMDGLAATKAIKEIYPQARIIIVTNHTDKRTRKASSDAGADAFFGKDDLLSLISLLKTKQQ
jgi:CheY-like chemotaxis protein